MAAGWRKALPLYLRGMAMGAADVVPGVSGGTIAFITGIYERLISALASVEPSLFRLWRSEGFGCVWQRIDGTFLVILFAGILTSVLTLARLISYLLAEHASLLWAFFFGLILGSVVYIARHIQRRDSVVGLLFIAGAMFAYALTVLNTGSLAPTHLNFFVAGAIAICAMILPGISGSFLLLLMGMYAPVLLAVKSLSVVPLVIFASGCLVGLLTFTHVLNYCLKHYHDATLGLLTGFMLGSLNKVWPWKYTVEYRFSSQGDPVPLQQVNVLPARFESITGEPSQVPMALALVLLGVAIVWLMEKIRTGSQKH